MKQLLTVILNFIIELSQTLLISLVLGLFFLLLSGFVYILIYRKRTLTFYSHMLYDDETSESKNVTYLRKNFNNVTVAFDKDVSMYYINIDNFKNYNDLLGHKLADQVLLIMAKRLKELVEPFSTVYRMHSDHFILLHPTHQDKNEQFSEQLLNRLKDPYNIGIHNIKLTVSIGRYDIAEKNPRFNECLLRSELALQEAKSQGKDRVVSYSARVRRRNHDAFTTYRLIKEALKDDGFYLDFQPIVDAKNQKVVGVESLIRMENQKAGIGPQEIINYAEKYHLIEEIDRFVVSDAFRAFKRFEDEGLDFKFMSVNISTTEIRNFSFIEYIVKQAKKHKITPSKVTIEFTETYYPEDFDKEAAFIKTLQAHGFKVAIDDFGSGYSSMLRLSQNKLDKIKIDRSFITNVHEHPSNQKIVEALIQLSNTFGLETIVEGVETKEELVFLLKKDITYLQGYYFYQALSEEVCVETFKKQ